MNIDEMVKAHGDQSWGDYPYVVHLFHVALFAQYFNKELNNRFDDEIVECASYAHDLIEDTHVLPADLDEGIRDSILLVSRNVSQGDVSYQEYIVKIAESGDELAVLIKLSDAVANYQLSRKNNNANLMKRYQKSIPVLYHALFSRPIVFDEQFDHNFAIREFSC